MEPAEENGHGEEFDVAWLPSEQTNQFDDFGVCKQEDDLHPEELLAGVHVPPFSSPPKGKR